MLLDSVFWFVSVFSYTMPCTGGARSTPPPKKKKEKKHEIRAKPPQRKPKNNEQNPTNKTKTCFGTRVPQIRPREPIVCENIGFFLGCLALFMSLLSFSLGFIGLSMFFMYFSLLFIGCSMVFFGFLCFLFVFGDGQPALEPHRSSCVFTHALSIVRA